MKKNKFLYYIINMQIFVFLLFFVAFLIVALVLREKKLDYLTWFYLAGLALLLAGISIPIYVKAYKTVWYREIKQSIREEKYKKIQPTKLKEYFYSKESNEQLFLGFQTMDLDEGQIFFREGKNIYNKKKVSYDIFYFQKDSVANSAEMVVERERIKKTAQDIDSVFERQNFDMSFINCVIFFQYKKMDEKEKNFYHNFTGFWDSEIKNERFIKNRNYTYCGIEQSSNQVYFYIPLSTDEGSEVDLSYLICGELKLTIKQ